MISAFVPVLLEAALRALLAAVAVWAGLSALRVSNVVVQKAAWGLVLAAALAMPFAPHWAALPGFTALRLPSLPLPAMPWDKAPSAKLAAASTAQPVPAVAQRAPEPQPQSTPMQAGDRYPSPSISMEDFPSSAQPAPAQLHLDPPVSIAPASAPPASTSASHPARSLSTATAFWTVYLGVFAALLLRLLVGLSSALRLWFDARPLSASSRFDAPAGVPIRFSARVASPVNIGSGVILPADFVHWDAEKLRVVLAHERSHIRQGDFYLQLLAGLYASLFWFSPLGWWLKRKLCELGEAISDRAGLEEAASRSSYAQLLLEFAALPRPTLTGVAMARTSHLAHRIERLLNESSFRQAFAAGGRRALLAVLLVPVALLAATALVRVEAATPGAQATGQSTPEQVTTPAPAPTPQAEPNAIVVPPMTPDPVPAAMPTAPTPPTVVEGPGQAPTPPSPPDSMQMAVPRTPQAPMPPSNFSVVIPDVPMHIKIDPDIRAEIAAARIDARIAHDFRFDYNFANNGEPYALVGDPGSKPRFNGPWGDDRQEEIEKARKVAHGHFLWFRHEGKSYIVDDPAIVSQLEALNKPMDELGEQMRALGKQMRELGQQQREGGKQMRDVTVKTPDLSKEMAELQAAVESLRAKQGGTISQKDLGELQGKIGRIQGELGSLQGKIVMEQMDMNGGMARFSEQQGKLGGEMGELGEKMGKLARENRPKIQGIIDESMKNGKARPVE